MYSSCCTVEPSTGQIVLWVGVPPSGVPRYRLCKSCNAASRASVLISRVGRSPARVSVRAVRVSQIRYYTRCRSPTRRRETSARATQFRAIRGPHSATTWAAPRPRAVPHHGSRVTGTQLLHLFSWRCQGLASCNGSASRRPQEPSASSFRGVSSVRSCAD